MKVGIDIGGSHIAIGIINEQYEIIERYEKDYIEEEKSNIIPTIEKYIEETVNMVKEKYNIEKIGIAVPGSTKCGIINQAINLEIKNYNIAGIITEKTGIEVSVINDAKSACLAEYENIKKDDKDNIQNMLFLTIGTGIGGGVIYNGKLLMGNVYDGFEFGHTVIKENGLPCKCGKKGCFERYGSILQYKNKVKERLNIPHEINAQPLRDIMNVHVEEIEDLRQEYLNDLAVGISNLINIFEPDCIVLGGGFTHFVYMFMEDLKDKIVNSNLLFNKRDDIDLRTANLGNDAGILGSVL
ncbi:MAG: ROK family protein [Clostridia bacterium]|nr:ROK family protein [Clostridia bacterium]